MIQTETLTDPERICDIKNCHSKAAGFIKLPVPPLPQTANRNKDLSKNSNYEIKEYVR